MSASTPPKVSFEFFPPKTAEGRTKLTAVSAQLQKLSPEFFSVTYGAGGSTREHTFSIVAELKQAGLNVAPHLSVGGDNEAAVAELLERYKALGINRIVALRGDMPSGIGGAMQMVYANELVAFVKQQFGDHFHIEVAAYPEIHPEAQSYTSDVSYLKGKFDAGADSAITQYFYNSDAYLHFIEQCSAQGITQPIVPGIMPITNYRKLARFSENCGAEIPRWVRKRLEAYEHDADSLHAFGIDMISSLCDTLLAHGAPGLHFYTMNHLEPTASILNNLGLKIG